MIRCLFFQISRNLRGQPIRKELLVSGEIIQIGRAAGCKILLLDHRVNLHHAVIRHSDEGRLYIESEEGANVLINGSFEASAELLPGMHIFVGPYELIIEAIKDDAELALSVELVRALHDDLGPMAAKQVPVTLAEAGLSKRRPALWLASLIIVFSLWSALDSMMPKWAASNMLSWQLGSMSRGHNNIRAKCDTCHQQAFVAVPDKACESCHKTVAKHIRDEGLNEKSFKDIRCVECHHDHRGEKGQLIEDQQCTACHAKIDKKNDKTRLENVKDFGTDHPPFSLSFKTGSSERDTLRISQKDKAKLIEKSGLIFSHKVHLDRSGISSPEGDTVMECRDCHREAGARFRPLSMLKDCQQSGCHALRFKPPAAGRRVPHGSVPEVMQALRDYHTATVIGKLAAGEKLLCGEGKNPIERALDCAYSNADANAKLLFSAETGCGLCHEIIADEANKAAPWKVAPVYVTRHWLRNAKFPHDRHNVSKCTECHDKMQSGKSSDVMIPAIEKCRECHTGSKPTKNRISSSCGYCHSFHQKTED